MVVKELAPKKHASWLNFLLLMLSITELSGGMGPGPITVIQFCLDNNQDSGCDNGEPPIDNFQVTNNGQIMTSNRAGQMLIYENSFDIAIPSTAQRVTVNGNKQLACYSHRLSTRLYENYTQIDILVDTSCLGQYTMALPR